MITILHTVKFNNTSDILSIGKDELFGHDEFGESKISIYGQLRKHIFTKNLTKYFLRIDLKSALTVILSPGIIIPMGMTKFSSEGEPMRQIIGIKRRSLL